MGEESISVSLNVKGQPSQGVGTAPCCGVKVEHAAIGAPSG